MKNFDEETRGPRRDRDRSFVLGGETFVLRSGVRPEEILEFTDLEGLPFAEVVDALDRLFLTSVEETDDAHGRYRRLRERREDAVTIGDLNEVCEWMMEVQTGRPTQEPSGSSGSPGNTGTTSTEGSSSPATPLASVA